MGTQEKGDSVMGDVPTNTDMVSIEYYANQGTLRDPKDSRHVVSYLKQKMVGINHVRVDVATKMFEIGCGMLRQKTKISMRDMGKILGMNYAKLSIAKTVASRLNCDVEKFRRLFIETGSTNFDSFAKELLGSKGAKASRGTASLRKVLDKVRKILASARATTDPAQEADITILKQIRDAIIKQYPLDEQVTDPNYIKYSPCCACNDVAIPPSGNKVLLLDDMQHIAYPLCETCFDENKPPDYKKVLELYAGYALNMQRAFDMIYIDGEMNEEGHGPTV